MPKQTKLSTNVMSRKTDKYMNSKKRKRKSNIIEYTFTRKELLDSLAYLTHTPPEKTAREQCLQRRFPKRKSKFHAALSFVHAAMELRECLLRNHWSDAVQLMLILLDGPKRLLPILWQNCFKILSNHPLSSQDYLEEFVRMTTGCSNPKELLQSLSNRLQS